MANDLGKIRQSAVIMNYGPGAIVDFRAPGTGAAVSVVAAGLEEWEAEAERAREAGTETQLRSFQEDRLASKLGVSYFRYPPVAPDDNRNEDDVIPLVGFRFPTWLQCPACDLVKPWNKWGHQIGEPGRFCQGCSRELPNNQYVFVVPVRFIVACRHGHLDDFPWFDWIHEGRHGCRNRDSFRLRSRGAGLASLVASCTNSECNASRSLEMIFKAEAHRNRKCTGARPWLSRGQEECDLNPVTVQRGASNLYFTQQVSALVIPPWSEEIVQALGHHWGDIRSADADQRENYIDIIWNRFPDIVKQMGKDSVKRFVKEKLDQAKEASSGNLKWDEYKRFATAAGGRGRGDEFVTRPESDLSRLPHLGRLIRVVSLREVRTIRSFTRIEAPPGSPPVRFQYLSRSRKNWLPAIDVRGEGIFLSLNQERLKAWETNSAVQGRAEMLDNFRDSAVLNPDHVVDLPVSPKLGARYLLLHSLAHVLMKQLSLQCGYSSASLRERIYAGEDETEMAGVLIYTATADSDGTLGGLQRQGKADLFSPTFIEAIRANEWCSSDPLCIKGLVAATEASSLAACHSCLLVPETSCEDYNRFLDRAMLVGTEEDRSIGFFSDLL